MRHLAIILAVTALCLPLLPAEPVAASASSARLSSAKNFELRLWSHIARRDKPQRLGNASQSLPVITGTEGLDVTTIRNALGPEFPLYETRTAASVLANVNRERRENGLIGLLGAAAVGEAELKLNMIDALILGRRYDAETSERELSVLAEQSNLIGFVDSDFARLVTQVGSPDHRWYAKGLALQLRGWALLVGSHRALIVDAIDPEGFLRQQIEAIQDSIVTAADSIMDLIAQ